MSALSAQKGLNKVSLKDWNVSLYVSFCQNFEEEVATIDEKVNVHPYAFYNQQFNTETNKENNMLPRGSGKKSIYTFNQDSMVFFFLFLIISFCLVFD